MNIVSVAGVAILGAILLLLLRELRPAVAYPTRTAALLVLIGASVALILPIVARIRSLLSGGETTQTEVILRALGVAMIAELAASFCRDLGEETLAEGVLFFGKAEILFLSLPLLEAVLSLAKELLSF